MKIQMVPMMTVTSILKKGQNIDNSNDGGSDKSNAAGTVGDEDNRGMALGADGRNSMVSCAKAVTVIGQLRFPDSVNGP